MQFDRQFSTEAARRLVAMVLLPIVIVVALHWLLGGPPDWQDVLRAAVWLLFLYIVVTARRYRERHGTS